MPTERAEHMHLNPRPPPPPSFPPQISAKVAELSGEDKSNGELYVKLLQKAQEKVGPGADGGGLAA